MSLQIQLKDQSESMDTTKQLRISQVQRCGVLRPQALFQTHILGCNNHHDSTGQPFSLVLCCIPSDLI